MLSASNPEYRRLSASNQSQPAVAYEFLFARTARILFASLTKAQKLATIPYSLFPIPYSLFPIPY